MPVLKAKYNGEWINVGGGGTSGGSNVNIDPTLTQSGSAADAKASGDAIRNLNTLVGNKPVAEQIQDAIGNLGGGGGGEGVAVQADWNQNDSTQLDYIKNRTHYDAGSPIEFPVFNGKSMTFTEEMNSDQTATIYAYEMQESDIFALNVGNTYYITIDDEVYTAECKDVSGTGYLGNLSIIISMYPNTGEPFMILPAQGMFFLNIPGETHDISISEVKSVIEKELVPNNEYTFSPMRLDMLPILINIGGFDLSTISKGDLCNVTFDGITYTNTIIDSDGALLFGNLGLISGGEGENTGEPYLGLYAEGMSGMYALTTTVQHQFSIDKVLEDSSYINIIPDGLYEFTYGEGGYIMMASADSGLILEADTNYKVSWGGTEYTCASVSQNLGTEEEPNIVIYIGNLSKIGMSDVDSGEPFIFGYAAAEGFMGMFIPDESFTDTHQIKVSGYVSGVKKLDKKYLPDNFDIPVASQNKVGGVKVRDAQSGLGSSSDYTPIYLDTEDNQIYAKARSSMSTLTFTGATSGSYNGSSPVTINIPTGVPAVSTSDNGKVLGVVNGTWAKYDLPIQEMNPLTFTGLVEGTYDGSQALTINIPIVRNSVVFLDQTTGEDYSVYVDNGQIVCKAVSEVLMDFDYTRNDDGTYTINSWKGTLNGETSTECVVPSTIVTIVE